MDVAARLRQRTRAMRTLAVASLVLTSLLACSSEIVLPGGGAPSTGSPGGSGGVAGGGGTGPLCALGGEACNLDDDCCSGWCGAGICTANPPPPCLADGTSCAGGGVCCNGPCTAGVCGPPTPPACALGSTQCVACVAQTCCPDLSACIEDPACAQGWSCFELCSQQGGKGNDCALKCMAQYPSMTGQTLYQCGLQACGSPCL
jgi:hypothetical protein